jgi:dihydroorotate dehydrogenase
MDFVQTSRHVRVKAALPMARKRVQWFTCDQPVAICPRKVMGIDFVNPLGLAGGFDRQGTMIDAAQHLGLGFMEIGSLEHSNLPCLIKKSPLGLNIAAAPHMTLQQALVHYVELAQTYRTRADFLVINLSSPRTRSFLQKGGRGWCVDLCQRVRKVTSLPICLKIRREQIPNWIDDLPLSGIVVSHIMPDRQDIKHLYADLGALNIISVGGVMTPEDVETRLSFGAGLVEIFSLLVLAGPKAVREMVQGLWP